MALNYVQSNTLYLSGSGVIIGATSIGLTNLTDIYANVLTMADFGTKGYGTLEPDTTNEEAFTFTGITANTNGTYTLTGVSTVLAKSPYTETSALIRAHSGGTKVVITDSAAFWNTFTNKNNDETINGQWTFTTFPVTPSNSNASTTVKGVTKLSVAPVAPTNPIAVGDNDTRVPTADPNTLYAPISVVYNPIASDYSDGNVTISVNTTLTRDMYYNALAVNAGVTLTTAGYRVFFRTLNVASTGVITNSGGNGGNGALGVGGTAGTAQAAGTLPAGRAGQVGAAGGASNGNAGTNSTFNIVSAAGANSGAGGTGSVTGGGSAGTGGTNTSTINAPRNAISAYYLYDFTSATAIARYNVNSGAASGAGGGQGDGSVGGPGGGGGGGGGGIVWLSGESIVSAGTISSNGGNGGNAAATFGTNSGGGGGGGGGNGGAIILIYSTFTNTGSVTVTAGSFGSGTNGNGTGTNGSNGSAGTAGVILQITK